MLRLRPYKPADAAVILSWCKSEIDFRKWTAGCYENYPIAPEDVNRRYFAQNGCCEEPDNFYPMTACDEDGVAGHFILRYIGDPGTLRVGFVIVDDQKRGRGYGKGMLRLAMKMAFEVMGARRLELGVFENNLPAYHCYKAAGFRDEPETDESYPIMGEMWKLRALSLTRRQYEETL